ncbi:MAG: hypothetical protein ACREIH_08750 [Nitrospiraceae bacterium]
MSAEGVVTVQWHDKDAGEKLTAEIAGSVASRSLGQVVNAVKQSHTGWAGGSFAINEYGKVISPIQKSLDRYLVGTVSGVPEFSDPRKPGARFTLLPDRDLPTGSRWVWPYLGMKFNLSADDRIYFKQDDEDGARYHEPPVQDEQLIAELRKVRPGGNVIRFIVNLHGAVFTRVEPDGNAVYVGYIDRALWFEDN